MTELALHNNPPWLLFHLFYLPCFHSSPVPSQLFWGKLWLRHIKSDLLCLSIDEPLRMCSNTEQQRNNVMGMRCHILALKKTAITVFKQNTFHACVYMYMYSVYIAVRSIQHSDDSATRTRSRCARPLGHNTPQTKIQTYRHPITVLGLRLSSRAHWNWPVGSGFFYFFIFLFVIGHGIKSPIPPPPHCIYILSLPKMDTGLKTIVKNHFFNLQMWTKCCKKRTHFQLPLFSITTSYVVNY